ncbi:MAG: glycosyltransferase family 39 protein [Candidatus Levybacteria bacterium]|nr:glycosyltransferase family 39 protein [Candidatus Levybacteria bacterium]
MINYLKKQKLQFYVFLGILLLGIVLRFYNYPYRYSLGEETIRDAVIGIEGARQIQFPLTGSFSSLGPFTFGPWYAYQLIFFYLIFPFIYSPWIYLSIISIIYIFIMYKIGRLLVGEWFGIILALLSAISPTQIISATHLTSHNNTNLFAALAVWIFLVLISENKSRWWGLLLGFVIGIGMNLHFQMGGLLILPLIALAYKRKLLNFLYSSLGVIISFIPMLIFEMNNHWFTTRNIFFYLTEGKNAIYVPNRWLFYVRDFWPSFWADALGIPVWFAIIVITIFILTLGRLYYKKKIPLALTLLVLAFLFNFVILRYYWGPRFFGYLNFLRPFVFIFTAFAIYNLRYKRLLIGLIILPFIVYFSFPRVADELGKDGFTMRIYNGVEELEKKYPNKEFTLHTCSKEYKSSYNSVIFSTLFILEYKNKYSDKGLRIGINNDCEYPKPDNFSNNTKEIESYPILSSLGIVDFSLVSESAIVKAGWEPISLSYLYDRYARWWFKEQP